MNVGTGEVFTGLRKGHAGADVLRFFKQIDASVPRSLDVHVVLDNLSAHSTPEIEAWLAHKNRRRWHLHFRPNVEFLAEPDRTVVQRTDRQAAAPRRLHQRHGPCRRDHHLGTTLELGRRETGLGGVQQALTRGLRRQPVRIRQPWQIGAADQQAAEDEIDQSGPHFLRGFVAVRVEPGVRPLGGSEHQQRLHTKVGLTEPAGGDAVADHGSHQPDVLGAQTDSLGIAVERGQPHDLPLGRQWWRSRSCS